MSGGGPSAPEARVSTVREAMVPRWSNPGQLPADASAQAAGELLQRPEVRAVYVTQDERLIGVVTRKTLVREVVAAGRDPGVTPLGAIAETPHYSIGPDVPLEDAFRFLEEEDAERVPVVDEHDRLIGVLSRRTPAPPRRGRGAAGRRTATSRPTYCPLRRPRVLRVLLTRCAKSVRTRGHQQQV